MVACKPCVDTAEKAFTVLVDICDAVSAAYPDSPVLMQAEKAMKRMILEAKKRYIASKIVARKIVREHGSTGKVVSVSLAPPEYIASGVELARRDNCELVPELMESVIEAIVINDDVAGARKLISDVLRTLLAGRMDMNKLVVSKSISKSEYKADPIQVQLAKRMAKRDPNYKVELATRVPYVIVVRPHKTLADQAEDPLYAIQHDLQIDVDYYIEKQLAGPLSRLFTWLDKGNSDYMYALRAVEERIRKLDSSSSATTAEEQEKKEDAEKKQLEKVLKPMYEHTKNMLFGPGALAKFTRKKETGTRGIAAFVKKVPKCLRCRTASASSSSTGLLCTSCMPGSARCLADGCKKSVIIEETFALSSSSSGQLTIPAKYCSTCTPNMGQCANCGRLMFLVESICLSCIDALCYACQKPGLETERGLCSACRPFADMHRSSVVVVGGGGGEEEEEDIEDLLKKSEDAKKECFDRCGQKMEEGDKIDCVAKECPTLYKRATLAVKIRNLKKKKN
jgi:hypothetical protein